MRILAITILAVLSIFSPALAAGKCLISVQPLGKVDPKLVNRVKEKIKKTYDADVVVNPARELPKEAYFPARGRYRAEKLLMFLNQIDTNSTKVLGLTTKDISTTKGQYPDWGIVGLGDIGGRACVISTFRMHGTKHIVSQQVFEQRCTKIVAHELGHTFGLQHCDNPGCLMQDYKGKVGTVESLNAFCDSCKQHLAAVLSQNALKAKN